MSSPDGSSGAPPSTTEARPVQIQFYAQLREDAGRSEETVQSTAATVDELFAELDQQYDFSVPKDDLRVAVNDSFVDWDTALDAQDLVVFIPPVAGG